MIGRLVLSDRNIFKIKIGDKQIQARKCNILSIQHPDVLIKTSKEFNTKDDYVKIDLKSNEIIEKFGQVGILQNDLDIYRHMYMLDWLSKSKYLKMWNSISTQFDLTQSIGISRSNYLNQVITIDPYGSVDLDDGFSFNWDDSYYYLDIHIADPISWFDLSNPTFIPILKELYTRVQTCYVGTNPTHLLPETFVNMVSLLEINSNSTTKSRRAITFCFTVSKNVIDPDNPIANSNPIKLFELKFTDLTNIKNYTYESYEDFLNQDTNDEIKTNLINVSNILIKIMGVKLEPISHNANLNPSSNPNPNPNPNSELTHRMIEIFMILTNWYGGNHLITTNKQPNIIIRTQDSSKFGNDFDINQVPQYARPILSQGANYVKADVNPHNEILNYHQTLGIKNYAHLSSPMRRFIDMVNHFGFYRIDLIQMFESICGNSFDLEKLNAKIKNYKKLSNGCDLIKFIKLGNNSNIFKACLFDWTEIDPNKIYCLLVLSQEQNCNNSHHNFIKVVNVELPRIQILTQLKKYMEFNVELYYNSSNFKSNKFPFSIKII